MSNHKSNVMLKTGKDRLKLEVHDCCYLHFRASSWTNEQNVAFAFITLITILQFYLFRFQLQAKYITFLLFACTWIIWSWWHKLPNILHLKADLYFEITWTAFSIPENFSSTTSPIPLLPLLLLLLFMFSSCCSCSCRWYLASRSSTCKFHSTTKIGEEFSTFLAPMAAKWAL